MSVLFVWSADSVASEIHLPQECYCWPGIQDSFYGTFSAVR